MSTALASPPICCDCGGSMNRLPSQWGYRWHCAGGCDVKAYENRDGTLRSSPAGPILRELRIEAHQAAKARWDYKDPQQRKAMYRWLKENTSTGHIGFSDAAECRAVITKLAEVQS